MGNRVTRILNARTRVGRGVSTLGMLSILGIGLVFILGAGSPLLAQTTTPGQKPETDKGTKATDATAGQRAVPETMTVTVVDEDGRPLPGVNFFVNASTRDGLSYDVINSNVLSDDDGVAKLTLPKPLNRARIWASKDGFVTLFFNWEEGETEQVPGEYDLVLQNGTKIAGIVVDAAGQPVAGAKVGVQRSDGGTKVEQKSRPKLGTWLAHGEDMAVTDDEGRWSIANAPAGDDLQLLFRIEHPDFIDDTSARRMGQYNVTLEQLRDGSARLEVVNGVSINGRITDPDGEPIEKGLVVWSDRPYWISGSQEVEIGADGRYEIPPQPAGDLRLTVVAPGWMPVDRVVTLSPGATAEQDFALEPGKRLQLKFVDGDGQPIPNVYVKIEEWHGKEALYNTVHSNVKSTEIPRRSNSQGVYTWDWAPADLIKLQVTIRDWQYGKEIEVVASEAPQTITVRKPFVLSGNVVDDQTGESINNYSVVPVIYRSDSSNARGIAQPSRIKTFNQSDFRIDDAFRFDDGRLVALRFQAVGYRDFTTQRFTSATPSLESTIRLQPATTRTVTVRAPDGSAVLDPNVWIAKPDQGTMINQWSNYFSTMDRGIPVDESGQATYGAPGVPHAVVVAHRLGYAEQYLDVGEQPKTLTLRPWAKMKGVLYQAGKPVSGAVVLVRPIRQLGGDHPHVQDIFQTMTDGEGRFVFENLPPVPSVVRSLLSPWNDYPITSSQELPIDLQPGEQYDVSLGGGGIQVTGKVKLLGDNADQLEFRYGLNRLVRLGGGVATPKHAIGKPAFEAGPAKQWRETMEAGLQPNVTRESFFVKLRDDGTFLISGVTPGRYRFLIKMYEPPTGCLVEPIGYGYLEFSTDDYALNDNRIDLGVIDVPLKPTPKVGDVLPDFRYQDMDGQPRRISESRGNYVMIDFWASWCQPCIKAFPDLAKIHNSLDSRQNASIISISVDEDSAAAKTVALREQLKWQVGFAGKSAGKGSSADALGISAVPTYLVLDPKGRVLYRGFDHAAAATFLPKQ